MTELFIFLLEIQLQSETKKYLLFMLQRDVFLKQLVITKA